MKKKKLEKVNATHWQSYLIFFGLKLLVIVNWPSDLIMSKLGYSGYSDSCLGWFDSVRCVEDIDANVYNLW